MTGLISGCGKDHRSQVEFERSFIEPMKGTFQVYPDERKMKERRKNQCGGSRDEGLSLRTALHVASGPKRNIER